MAVASAGTYANLHLAQTDSHATPHHSVFFRPYALLAAQPTASEHCRHFAPENTEDCEQRYDCCDTQQSYLCSQRYDCWVSPCKLNREDAMGRNRWRKQMKDDLMIRMGVSGWVNVSFGTGSPGLSQTKSRELCVCVCTSYSAF